MNLINDLQNEVVITCIKIYKAPYLFLKIFLFFFVLISSCLASFMVIQSIVNYFEYPVITTSRSIFETPTVYPKISICNLNIFTTKYGYEFLARINSTWNIFKLENFSKLSYKEKFNYISEFNTIATSLVSSDVMNDDERKKISQRLEDIVLDCSFNQESCNLTEDFVWKFDRLYGNCYEFNSGLNAAKQKVKLKKSNLPGSLYGLQLKLYVNFYQKLRLYNSIYIGGQYLGYLGGLGALVRVQNNSYLSDYVVDGFKVPSGFQTDISLERVFKFNLGKM